MRKVLITFIVIVGVMFSYKGSVIAAGDLEILKKDLDDVTLGEVEKEYRRVLAEIEGKDEEVAKLILEIEKIEIEKQAIEEVIRLNREEIKKVEKEIDLLEEEIAELEEEIGKRQKIMLDRLHAQQLNGSISYLDVLLGSKSFKDFISILVSMSTILEADNDIVKGFQGAVQKLDDKLNLVGELRESLQEIEDLNKKQMEELEVQDKFIKEKKDLLEVEIEKLGMDSEKILTYQADLREHLGMKRDLSGAKLEFPVDEGYISSPMGYRIHPITGERKFHKGIDLARVDKTTLPPVYASEEGVVKEAGYEAGYGNYVKLDHGNGLQTLYAHLDKVLVKEGQKVVRGERVGIMGTTGMSTGVHLHYEVIDNGRYQNPIKYIFE